ncbi:MAG: methylenetetrahydrofolate--tRNA-(uracil(54)-C(5))-methyltransferase (FADH(2)-oxidizing) TrmFO [Oscillospiraceae bacterium]|nr:methylenetetrahydrofolate--tRNA-(uracil(54)-C(5))-methyltransferase (FADH(2)-oxidizing) TrmFO [Oscillospiraceae bacterium]
MEKKVKILGAGLAGCEAAWFLAQRGVQVTLYEQKPVKFSPAHKSENFAELVCSNSLKSMREDSCQGMLKNEMRHFGSIVLENAEKSAVPAGGALAVDRDIFSDLVTQKVKNHPNITICYEEVTEIDTSELTIVATGPLTEGALYENIKSMCGQGMSFYDAAAPIVMADSIDMEKVFAASRYGKGDDDYLNCPFNKEEYEAFYEALVNAERAPLKNFEDDLTVYEGCMPVEVMAGRGADTLRYGPMRPVGLRDPKTGHRPWANVQLRCENKEKTMYNLVGFQTNLKFGEQKRVFCMIPGLENAQFVRYGVMHRNSFINSPVVLNNTLNLKEYPNVYFAGQITGMEGYTESSMCGLLAGYFVWCRLNDTQPEIPPLTTISGALLNYITTPNKDFQPMGANMGILPPLENHIRDKRERYMALSRRGKADIEKISLGYKED